MKGFNFLIIFFIIFVSSCTMEEYDESKTISTESAAPEFVVINDMITRSVPSQSNDGLEVGCVLINYPFKLITIDSAVHLINTNVDFHQLDQQNELMIVDFIYPLEITDDLGLTHIVNNLWDLASYFAGCFPTDTIVVNEQYFPAFLIDSNSSCYTLKYPIKLKDGIDKNFIVNTDNELITLLSQKDLFFEFPLILIKNSIQEKVINSPSELEQALFDCNSIISGTFSSYEYLDCYKLIFPFDINILGSEDTYSVTSPEKFEQVFNQGKFIDFVYPLLLESEGGMIISIENEIELSKALAKCSLEGDFYLLMFGTSLFSTPPCYDLVFPLQAISPNGSIETYQNLQNIEPLLSDSTIFNYKLIYPLEVTRNNIQKSLKDGFDLLSLLEECN